MGRLPLDHVHLCKALFRHPLLCPGDHHLDVVLCKLPVPVKVVVCQAEQFVHFFLRTVPILPAETVDGQDRNTQVHTPVHHVLHLVQALFVPLAAFQTPPLSPAPVAVCNYGHMSKPVHEDAPVAGKPAVTTPLLALLLTLVAPSTVKKLAATPSSLYPAFGVRVMVAV